MITYDRSRNFLPTIIELAMSFRQVVVFVDTLNFGGACIAIVVRVRAVSCGYLAA